MLSKRHSYALKHILRRVGWFGSSESDWLKWSDSAPFLVIREKALLAEFPFSL